MNNEIREKILDTLFSYRKEVYDFIEGKTININIEDIANNLEITLQKIEKLKSKCKNILN